jgi:mannose-6-phosphate isomerase-like protein (cupin superfamily)
MLQPLPVHRQHPRTYLFLGVRMNILLSSEETGGQLSLIEGIMPPGGDGGLHVHANEDEAMHLLEGELEVTIGEKVFTLAAGESYFAPRTVPHQLRNLGQVPARGLVTTTPGGFDRFISRAAVPLADGAALPPPAAPTAEEICRILAIADRFGIAIIAPGPDCDPD